jgi:hypothetical protein
MQIVYVHWLLLQAECVNSVKRVLSYVEIEGFGIYIFIYNARDSVVTDESYIRVPSGQPNEAVSFQRGLRHTRLPTRASLLSDIAESLVLTRDRVRSVNARMPAEASPILSKPFPADDHGL